MKQYFLVLGLIYASFAIGQNTTIVVAADGSDSNPGTDKAPLCTIEKALQIIQEKNLNAKDTFIVSIQEGTYRIPQGLEIKNAASICIQGVDKDKVKINGGIALQNFRKLSHNHPLYKKNPKAGKEIIEIDLSQEKLSHEKIRLAGFDGTSDGKPYTLYELIFNGKPMALSRYPNTGYMKLLEGVKDTTGSEVKSGIKYRDDQISQWINEPNVLLHGYWFWLWADAYEHVKEMDVKNKTIWFQNPVSYYSHGVDKPFAAYNVILEIDQPGEYAYDYQNRKIYFYPPSELKNSSLELSACKSPILKIDNSSQVTLKDVTLINGASSGIEINESSNVTIEDCIIHSVARNGISINGGADNAIKGCEIYNTGRGAITLKGGSYLTLEKCNFLVENCHMHDLSRIDKTYTPGIYVEAVGVTITNCEFHDIPSSAIRLDGNDHLVQYNEVYRCVTESDDQGAIDMWGTQNFRGNVIRYNYFYDIGPQSSDKLDAKHGRAGIRFDDAISGCFVYGNVFNNSSKGSFGAIQIHGGKDNTVWNNLFYNCEIAISFSPWGRDFWEKYTQKAKEFFNQNRLTYISKYPALVKYDDDLNRNTIVGNLIVDCARTERGKGVVNSWNNNPEINDGNNPVKSILMNELLRKYHNQATEIQFIPIPFEQIGLK